MMKEEGPENNIVRLLEYIGDDPTREGVKDTPKRVIKSFEKIYGGYKEDVSKYFKTFTEGACDEMVVLKNIEFYSTCEHHMLPFYGKAHVAYIPNGKVIGISKLARILEVYSRRLQIQERICQQVTQTLEGYLQPLGAACILEAQHFCMVSRGVEKQNSIMITSSLTGVFRKESSAKNELFQIIKG
jgi:GTP cyclohydrolase I